MIPVLNIIPILRFSLKGAWDQSNNFCLKWSFFTLKQNGINKKFQKFTCKPQSCFVCSFAWMTSLTLRYRSTFKTSQLNKNTAKNTKKLYRRIFIHKTNKIMQVKPGVKYFSHLRVWCHLHWIQNFVSL